MGGLAGVPLVAAAYRRLDSRRTRTRRSERLLVVRPTIEPELIDELVDFVRNIQGRAALQTKDTIAVPLPDGADEDVAYGELRALLHRWELLHPGIRLMIVPGARQKAAALGSAVTRRARRTAKVH